MRTIRGSFPKAQLYLFPELYLAGDQPFRAHVPTAVNRHRVPGPFTDRIGEVARRAKRWIQAGSIYEAAGAKTYNTALLFAPDGSLVSSYRKLFPWMPFEVSDPGSAPPPVHTIPRVGTAGMMICYDGWFPEVPRSLALQGAEVILHPTLTSTPDREEELVLARANAIANQCFVLNVNGSLDVGGGRSIGVDPEGRVLFEGGSGEEYFSEVLDLERVATVRERGTRGMNRLFWQLTERGREPPGPSIPPRRGAGARRTLRRAPPRPRSRRPPSATISRTPPRTRSERRRRPRPHARHRARLEARRRRTASAGRPAPRRSHMPSSRTMTLQRRRSIPGPVPVSSSSADRIRPGTWICIVAPSTRAGRKVFCAASGNSRIVRVGSATAS